MESSMKRENLKKLAQLKAVILGMEKDFGLDDLDQNPFPFLE
jgi:hypothetical protein